MFTVPQIIDIAKLSQAYAANDIELNGLYGGGMDLLLPQKLFTVRKDIEWLYNLKPSDVTLTPTSNYLYALCGKYALLANATISGGGAVVVPIVPSPAIGSTLNWIEVRKADFANTTDYVDSRLAGKEMSVLGSWLGSRLIEEGIEWETINGGGIRILIAGFDSTTFDDETIIFRIDINGDIAAGASESTYTYDLTADATSITNLPTGTSYQIRNVIIKPNGYTYTWGTDFKFTDNWPEQPDAISANTKQVYTFMYIAGVGDVCIGQSLNISLS